MYFAYIGCKEIQKRSKIKSIIRARVKPRQLFPPSVIENIFGYNKSITPVKIKTKRLKLLSLNVKQNI